MADNELAVKKGEEYIIKAMGATGKFGVYLASEPAAPAAIVQPGKSLVITGEGGAAFRIVQSKYFSPSIESNGEKPIFVLGQQFTVTKGKVLAPAGPSEFSLISTVSGTHTISPRDKQLVLDEKSGVQTLTLAGGVSVRRIKIGEDAVVGFYNMADERAAAQPNGETITASNDKAYGQIVTIKGGKDNLEANNNRLGKASVDQTNIVAKALSDELPENIAALVKKQKEILVEVGKSVDPDIKKALTAFNTNINSVQTAQIDLNRAANDMSVAFAVGNLSAFQSASARRDAAQVKVGEAIGKVDEATNGLNAVIGDKFPEFKAATGTINQYVKDKNQELIKANISGKAPGKVKVKPLDKVIPRDTTSVLEVAMNGIDPDQLRRALGGGATELLTAMANASNKPDKAPATTTGVAPGSGMQVT